MIDYKADASSGIQGQNTKSNPTNFYSNFSNVP